VAARDAWLRWVDDDGGAAHPSEHR
jgi:hypothetical protein